jgi:N-acetyl-gamma-glutamyl-phosphate reductase
MNQVLKTAIFGASGYSGAELLRILSPRTDVEVVKLFANASAGKNIDELYPMFSGVNELPVEHYTPGACDGLDLAFIAMPSGEAMKIVPELQSYVGKIIDLGGDFRLPNASLYKNFYKHEHHAPELLGGVTYGLPEEFKNEITSATLIANPGCYPTSAILPLIPVLRERLIEPAAIAISSMSGVSGAGRSASTEMSFAEVNENVRAYKIGSHQHIPEMQTVLSKVSGENVTVSFIPHLIPITRGIYTTIHASLTRTTSTQEVYDLFKAAYADAPFVRIRKTIPQIKDVVLTNYCDIGFAVDENTNQLVLISVIDNLMKGAAGQAVQNMNLMYGFPETAGLL